MTYELNTTIANLQDLRQSDLRDYDAVYLGDIYCRLYESNFLERLTDLKEGLRILRDQGKRAYVTTYAAPRNDFLPKVRKMLAAAAEGGADAVEVHNLGVVRIVLLVVSRRRRQRLVGRRQPRDGGHRNCRGENSQGCEAKVHPTNSLRAWPGFGPRVV